MWSSESEVGNRPNRAARLAEGNLTAVEGDNKLAPPPLAPRTIGTKGYAAGQHTQFPSPEYDPVVIKT
jgi:hypothetical protein